jgi:hypothetical protein
MCCAKARIFQQPAICAKCKLDESSSIFVRDKPICSPEKTLRNKYYCKSSVGNKNLWAWVSRGLTPRRTDWWYTASRKVTLWFWLWVWSVYSQKMKWRLGCWWLMATSLGVGQRNCDSVVLIRCCQKLVTEARGWLGNPEAGERRLLEAVTKQRLVVTVIDWGHYSVCDSDL